MSPLSFTDEELHSLTTLPAPLPHAARDGFLQMVAGKLSAYPPEARGPGLVHRLATEAQRDFQTIPHHVRRETAALRGFDPANVRFGSISTEIVGGDRRAMSGMDR